MAAEDQLGPFGDVELLARNWTSIDLERLAADRFDLDVGLVELGDQRGFGIDPEIGQMDPAGAITADLHFIAVDPAGPDDFAPAGLQRDLADKKAHALTSRRRR